MTKSALAIAITSPMAPRRGLNREEAARYIGISPGKFDELILDGKMPRPRLIGARKVWDIRSLDRAFDELPHDGVTEGGSSWNDR